MIQNAETLILCELVLRKRAKLGNAAITALEISADGSLLGVGTLEGESSEP